MKVRLDIKKIQYINLFEKTTRIKAKYCFDYDPIMVFIVPRLFIAKAIGEKAINVNRLSKILNKRVRIVADPSGIHDLENFIKVLTFPNKPKRIFLKDKNLTIFSAPKTKAILIGRGKIRLKELSEVLKRFFGIEKIIIR